MNGAISIYQQLTSHASRYFENSNFIMFFLNNTVLFIHRNTKYNIRNHLKWLSQIRQTAYSMVCVNLAIRTGSTVKGPIGIGYRMMDIGNGVTSSAIINSLNKSHYNQRGSQMHYTPENLDYLTLNLNLTLI